MPAGVVLPFWLDRPPGEVLNVAANAAQPSVTRDLDGEMLHFDAFALPEQWRLQPNERRSPWVRSG